VGGFRGRCPRRVSLLTQGTILKHLRTRFQIPSSLVVRVQHHHQYQLAPQYGLYCFKMSTKFLFVNEDETSFPVRAKRILTSVRRHVRLQRGRNSEEQKQLQLQMRALPPKALGVSTSETNTGLTSRTATKCAKQTKRECYENSIKLPIHLDPFLKFDISHRIRQRYPDAYKLMTFYLSGECSQAHLSLHCTTEWSPMIIRKALESECHTLFLLCYISSIISYLNYSAKNSTTLGHERRSSPSSDVSSNSSFSLNLDDWE
jgi:hypothetical protein